MMFLLFIFSQSLFLFVSSSDLERTVQVHDKLSVSWTVLENDDKITFNISGEVPPNKFIAIGISHNGAMRGSDIFVAKMLSSGEVIAEDRHGIGNQEPVIDKKQDWSQISFERNLSQVKVQVSRLLKTGDEKEDVEISVDTMRLMWASGPVSDDGSILYHGPQERGFISVNFLDPDVETPTHSQLAEKYSVFPTQKTVKVSSNDTVYMCSFFKGPDLRKKNHMVGFGMHVQPEQHLKRLHHADLYRCTAPEGVDPNEFFAPFLGDGYDCNYSPVKFPYENCGTFEFQWTLGGGITLFPENLGLPVGRDDGAVEYFMTEVHFDNPERRSDLEITAGFNIYYTNETRETEIGQLQLGFMTNKTYSLTVPPNSTDFVISSHCPMDCTKNLPSDGINIFTYLLHSHKSGRRLKLRHFRGDEELPVLAKDDSFDFNYQNNRRLRNPAKIMPGDHLTMECTYDSNWKNGLSTLGGRSAREEMCQAFLLYWPRIEGVNSCGSYHRQEEILNYMGILSAYQDQGEIDATITLPESLAGMKYSQIVENRIQWTKEKRDEFQELMQYGRQQAYCIPIAGSTEYWITYPKLVPAREIYVFSVIITYGPLPSDNTTVETVVVYKEGISLLQAGVLISITVAVTGVVLLIGFCIWRTGFAKGITVLRFIAYN